MPIFKSPIFTKQSSGSDGQTIVQCYTFPIEYLSSDTEDHIEMIAETESDLTLDGLLQCLQVHSSWWNRFIDAFLVSSSKLFSKSYTLEQINRITTHVLPPVESTDVPCTVHYTTKQIKIYGGRLYVYWTPSYYPMTIDLPDSSPSTPRLDPLESLNTLHTSISYGLPDELEEVDVGELPAKEDDTEMNPSHLYDRQCVKEARLKAKLALYKAQYHMRRYYDKYGIDYSDSDSDAKTSDDEDDEEYDDEDEDEDVQL